MSNNPIQAIRNKNTIARFKISGLFGNRNYDIPIEDGIKILVGENGSGKSTIVNLIKSAIRRDIESLRSFRFDELSIVFLDGCEFKITSNDIKDNNIYDIDKTKTLGRIATIIPSDRYKILAKHFNVNTHSQLINTKFYKTIIQEYGQKLNDHIETYYNLNRNPNPYLTRGGRRVSELHNRLIYLATYRRIDIDEHAAGIYSSGNKLTKNHPTGQNKNDIKFGMHDISNLIYNFLDKLKNDTVSEFHKISTRIINTFSSNTETPSDYTEILSNTTLLHTLLERVSDEISPESISHIIKLSRNGTLLDKNNEPLAQTLYHFASSFQTLKKNEQKMENFVNTCNTYLFDKRIAYNENELTWTIKHADGATVDIEHISSGEKQIISTFAQLILTDKDDSILFFDEPEMSISIEWQKKYLVDIASTKSCSLIFSATHSPFIFDNELINYTYDISDFQTPTRN